MTSIDYSEFSVTPRSTKRPDQLPNRIARFWLYLNSQRSNKDFYLMISRERVLFDLNIKDSTLQDWINGTNNYKHMWSTQGGFINFSTLYGGNILVVFAGYANNREGNLTPRLDRMRGSILELTDKMIKARESGKDLILEKEEPTEEELEDDS